MADAVVDALEFVHIHVHQRPVGIGLAIGFQRVLQVLFQALFYLKVAPD